MQHYGIRGHLNDWVADFLRDRQQEVVLEGAHSSPTKVTSGVPQGTVLGPLLFLVYINDMPEGINSTVRLFADDSLVYRIIRSIEDQTILQEDLRKLQEWERKWQMQFNADKCEVLRITKKKNPTICNYSLHDQHLQTVKQAKYLGATISSDLSWNQHVDNTVKKATNSLNFLRRNIRDCPPQVKEQLGLLRVSEYSDIRGSEFKIEYEYSSLPKSLDLNLFFFFFFTFFQLKQEVFHKMVH